jgi:hypothetical protein
MLAGMETDRERRLLRRIFAGGVEKSNNAMLGSSSAYLIPFTRVLHTAAIFSSLGPSV